jgi:diamine N-acetyltransferase
MMWSSTRQPKPARAPVADDQRDLLPPPVVESIAWAYVAPVCHPLGIATGDSPVGFVMNGREMADRHCWIVDFMVDARQQRRGRCRAALELLLARLAVETGGANIDLSVHPHHVGAIRLYAAFGFQDTGRRQCGEQVLRCAAASLSAGVGLSSTAV